MSFDTDRATAAAFHAVTEVSRILSDAVRQKQEFSVDVQAGIKDGTLDGGYRVQIVVSPASCAPEPASGSVDPP
jgi:hypothetical protein